MNTKARTEPVIENELVEQARILRMAAALLDGRSANAKSYRHIADVMCRAAMWIRGAKATAAAHPSPAAGGPCATCVFRLGTQANQTSYTVELATACVEGITPFDCHERPQLCRGFVAAVNVRWGGEQLDESSAKYRAFARMAAEVLNDAIAVGKAADESAAKSRREREAH